LLEDGEERVVAVVRRETIFEIDALAGDGLVDTATLSVNHDINHGGIEKRLT
jgi:hypothetical protein